MISTLGREAGEVSQERQYGCWAWGPGCDTSRQTTRTTVPTRVPLPKAPGWANGEGAASGDPSEASHGPHQIGEKALAQCSRVQVVT